ncbi:MAG: sodium:proton antiporter [Verrucomicrobiota bacterium]|nr:sodium:proton antiporter [Verrucomicrobiota bacterium]
MGHDVVTPTPWMILPFIALLAMIALGPLAFPKWWHHHYPKVAIGLGLITISYYLFGLHATTRVFHVAHEYVSFIAIIGSLYVIAGGIHINVKGEATPGANVVFLFLGAALANVIGTTGASMLLIRPWIRMNKYRITAYHIVFFIFLISNLGGCLTPIGDPPLFIGYLKGVPFWWVAQSCWPMWLTAIGSLLVIFFALDYRNYLKAPKAVRRALAEPEDTWQFQGMRNVFFLALVLMAVFIQNPIFLREGIMIGAAIASYFLTKKEVHHANDFNFAPLKEVVLLFIGIFATMIPALDWLEKNSSHLTNATPGLFYWACGLLSAFLDNAPTYYSFLTAIFGLFVSDATIQQVQALIASSGDLATVTGPQAEQIKGTYMALKLFHPDSLAGGKVSMEQIQVAYLLGNTQAARYLLAISLGAVFFGAMTYIGNGPNFMVKSIAESNKVHVPTFFGYLFKFAVPYLLPVLVLVWLLFLR